MTEPKPAVARLFHSYIVPELRATVTESMLGRALARFALGEVYKRTDDTIVIMKGDRGRPYAYVDSVYASFSISHSDGLVVVAVAHEAMFGVDIEPLANWSSVPYERIFSATDVARVAELDAKTRDRELTRLWTVYEACMKASGDGLYGMLGLSHRIGPKHYGKWVKPNLNWCTMEVIADTWLAFATDGTSSHSISHEPEITYAQLSAYLPRRTQ